MKSGILIGGLSLTTVGAIILLDYYRRKIKRLSDKVKLLEYRKRKRGDDINVSVLFCPDDAIVCRNYLFGRCNGDNCNYSHRKDAPLTRLVNSILDARKSIDLALFEITSEELSEALLLKLECGVNIRLIVDSEYMFVTGSKVPILAQAGVKVIHDHTTGLFHHKFAIIDQKILITGSLNWTRQAIIGNYENVLIMKHEETINAYEKEYLRMWETIEGIMKRKGVETEKKLELQVELDEDWE